MRLADLTGRRVVLLGLGADVRAGLGPIIDAGPADVRLVNEAADALPLGDIPLVTLDAAAADADVFVRSPGFPRYQPPLLDALARGALMTTPLDLWLGTVGPSRTVVAITGTKGKSTVTSLVGVLAAQAGLRIGVAGNLGIPVFSTGWDHEAPVVVLEVSSYQAADLHHPPDVGVLTFLSEDHLSWHGGVERYVADKLRVLRNDGGTAGRILVPASGGGRALEALGLLESGFVSGPGARLPVEAVVSPAGCDRSIPVHRLQNAALAAAVVSGLCGEPVATVDIEAAARTTLPGRLDVCPGPTGLLCLDDALASNPSAVAAGLAWLRTLERPTVVLLGGQDRGVDSGPLADEARRWPVGMLQAVALPASGLVLAQQCGIEVLGEVSDVGAGVDLALTGLHENGSAAGGSGGGVVILSPGAPTPALVGNWETRSNQFRAAVGAAKLAVGKAD